MTRNYRYPGAFIPVELDDYGLDPIAFRLYAYFAQLRELESFEEIAKHCGISLADLMNAERTLVAAGVITRELIKDRLVTDTWPFTYVLTPVDEWVPKQIFHAQKEEP